ncbi:MAG: glycosyltransferase family 4 protein [Lachnospiraceae bacterium]|nr:glycosyltransferase family 4 protein [Lachnospiraceae bacterium]
MNLLLSAYACRPTMGSEPAVGWSWVLELSKYHHLWVLTNGTNEKDIEEYKKKNPKQLQNVEFIYIHFNSKYIFWYKEWERFERLYYFLWQRRALRISQRLSKQIKFDYVQHLTYVSFVLPTYLYKLKIPFIYGPISGGENIPKAIKYPMSMKDRGIEAVRKLSQSISIQSVRTRRAFKNAKWIIAVTDETRQQIPFQYQEKVKIVQAIGINSDFFSPNPQCESKCKPLKILMAGRMLYWKGFNLGMEAAVQALDEGADIQLTVLGEGEKSIIENLKQMAGEYLNRKIHFISRVKYEDMKQFYDQFGLLLNCSLRDSGCLVVMEGMSRGLPVICVDTGGPKVNTTAECAIKIEPMAYRELVTKLKEAIIDLYKYPERRTAMSKASYDHAIRYFDIENKVKEFQKYYE